MVLRHNVELCVEVTFSRFLRLTTLLLMFVVSQMPVEFRFMLVSMLVTQNKLVKISAGIEMQFQYQTLIWLCILINIEISFHTIKCIILHLLILQLSNTVLHSILEDSVISQEF